MQEPSEHRDIEFMSRALVLARRGAGFVGPNPLVGCVIVKNGALIGEGYHEKYGEAHAEVNAVRDAEAKGNKVDGTIAYVTLEPCTHLGKTPPCADLLIEKKISRCVIAMQDPYKEVNGSGIKKLQKAGIEVTVGVCEDEAREINKFFIKHVTTGLPYVTLKIAMSLDGKVALKSGKSKWISSEPSRAVVHRMRSEYDAVLVASATVIADDPELTVRLVEGRDPKRIVLDASLRLTGEEKIFSKEAEKVILLTTHPAYRDKTEKAKQLEARGVKIHKVGTIEGQLDLNEAFHILGKEHVASILVEPGPTLATAMLRAGQFDELALFLAPIVLGDDARSGFGEMYVKDLAKTERLKLHSTGRIEGSDDIFIRYKRT
jgi:diaminohydroxyphosphoribosylaminopyrimidine deaminase/5-amino-6-(5-phosphoribosylamino)uracil reductase